MCAVQRSFSRLNPNAADSDKTTITAISRREFRGQMAFLIAIKAAKRKARPFLEGRRPMRRMPAILAMSGTLVLACLAAAQATSTYDYKPHEYALVDGGLAPNKRLSIAANGYGSFHVYLMAEP